MLPMYNNCVYIFFYSSPINRLKIATLRLPSALLTSAKHELA